MHHSIREPQNNHLTTNRSSDANLQTLAYREASRLLNSSTRAPNRIDGATAVSSFAGTGEQMPPKVSHGQGQMWSSNESPDMIEKFPANQSARNQYSKGFVKTDKSKNAAELREQSPSYIAALLAVAKHPSSQHDAVISRQFSGSPGALPRAESDPSIKTWSVDKTPIAATNALVKLFDSPQEHSSPLLSQRMTSIQRFLVTDQSPRHFEPSATGHGGSIALRNPKRKVYSERPNVSLDPPFQSPGRISSGIARLANPEGAKQESSNAKIDKGPPPPPPLGRSSSNGILLRDGPRQDTSLRDESDGSSSASSYSSALDKIQSPQPSRFLAPNSNTNIFTPPELLAPINQSESAGHPSITSGRTKRSYGNKSHVNTVFRPKNEGILLSHSLTPQLTANSLANAMVASSLASSRAQSPSRPMHPPLQRQSKSYLLFHRSHSQELVGTRTPSPGKATMRQTMREALKSDDESERIKKNRYILKKHPNKHHEGDRKKWRDQITEQERKRYEGVWAANKSLPTASQDTRHTDKVINLVVRDIWCRSRLNNDVLQDIWDLVDNEGAGRLTKDEFVVGMWLIDQRLKGRKLPVKVSESVWSSARNLSGIKVPRKH